MADNKKTAEEVLKAVGGPSNITMATHCITRLRFNLKDQSIPDDKAISAIPGVVGVNRQGGQYQVIIGNNVGNVYAALMDLPGMNDLNTADEPAEEKKKGNPISIALEFIAACMTPLFAPIIAGSFVKVLLIIFGPNLLGVLSETSDTYIILNALGDAPFYFLPITVAFTAAKKLKCNPYMAVMISSVLLYPSIVTLLSGDTPTKLFGFLPVTHGSYSSSIIPAILSTILMKYVDQFSDKITPSWGKSFLKPLLTVLITTPVTLCVLAPLGLIIGNGVQAGISAVYNFAPWLAMTILGAFMPFIVMTGMHWAFTPASLQSMVSVGYEFVILPATLCSNTAQAGACFGVAVKSKNRNIKEMAAPAGITALLAGVTEPALYGVTMPLKTPLIAACIAGGCSGLVAGLFNLKSYAFVVPCLTSLISFVSPDDSRNIIIAVICFLISLVLSFVLAFIMTKPEEAEAAAEEETAEETAAETDTPAEENGETEVTLHGEMKIESPVKGQIIPLSEVKDQTFASGMLGKGFAVVPSEGKVYAPFDGKCATLFFTKHALGLVSNEGVEMLVHVGLDTVNLKGEPFTAHINTGDTFHKGDLLLEFDIDMIKKAGLETQTPVLITNADSFDSVEIQDGTIIVKNK